MSTTIRPDGMCCPKGHKMTPRGYGQYPYDCTHKDKHPHSMIYVCDECRSWEADDNDTAPEIALVHTPDGDQYTFAPQSNQQLSLGL